MTNKTTKRFGPRYGRTVKDKLAIIEAQMKASYKCPYCSAKKVKRTMAGVWSCSKCGKTFTSKAYYYAAASSAESAKQKE